MTLKSINIFKIFRMATVFLIPLIVLTLTACGKKEKEDNRGSITILSTPDNATVSIVGLDMEIGVTPKRDGKLPPGTYIFRFSKLNYKNAWEKVVITPKSQNTLEVKLEPITASVMLTSIPNGAEVTFEGRKLGFTPLTVRDLPIGKYSASLKLPAYAAKEINWEVNTERPFAVKTNLTINVGTLKVESEPENASISVDDVPKGNTPFEEPLEQGPHKIRILKDGYVPFEQIVTVDKAKLSTVSAKLEVLPSTIKVTSEPSDASVFVNGKQYNNTPTELNSIMPGTYTVRVEKAGFDPASRDVTVTPGQNFEVALNLDSNTGGFDLSVNPSGVTVYLDGKVVGTTEPDSTDLETSKVFSIRNLSAGKHTIMVAHKRAIPNKRTIDIKLSKGEVLRLPVLNMWIPNAILKMKNGTQYPGRIVNTDVNAGADVMFEPEPGIRQVIKRVNINEIVPLKDGE